MTAEWFARLVADYAGDPDRWQVHAACRGMDPDLWFPQRGTSQAEAKAVCAICPVRSECLEYAIANRERYGIFGGLNEGERRGLRRAKPKPKAVDDGEEVA